MAGTITVSTRKGGGDCDHRTISVAFAFPNFSETITVDTGENPLDAMPFGADEKKQLAVLLLKIKRLAGLALDNAVGRVCLGEEATNLKQYALLCKDVTKTNIGLSYVNIPIGANGERSLVDFTGCTEFRPVLHANLVGTGPFGARIVKDSDNTVLYENANIALTGERELDPGWAAIPQGFTGLEVLRVQGKSATAADDPVFRRCILLVR